MSMELQTMKTPAGNTPAELHPKRLGLNQSRVHFHEIRTRDKLASFCARLPVELIPWRCFS